MNDTPLIGSIEELRNYFLSKTYSLGFKLKEMSMGTIEVTAVYRNINIDEDLEHSWRLPPLGHWYYKDPANLEGVVSMFARVMGEKIFKR